MDEQVKQRIERAKMLVKTARHGTMATVNADGSPHNSPFYLMLDEKLGRLYWGSHPDSLHSQNILRTGQLFVVVYDMMEKGGLYLNCKNGHELEGDELVESLRVHNRNRARDGKEPIPLEYYQADTPQKMYGADITGLWVNQAERGEDGMVIRDYRFEVTPSQLIN